MLKSLAFTAKDVELLTKNNKQNFSRKNILEQ